MTRMGRKLYFVTREEWREWLRKNHASEKEVWLVHYKKHTGKSSIPYEDAVEEAICFGWIDGLLKRIDDERYALRYSPRKSTSIWSGANKKRSERMIAEGRMTEAGLVKIREAKQSGEWEKSRQREEFKEIPPDLKKALAADPKALQNFEKLPPSNKKQYMWWIYEAKKEETRKRRMDEAVRILSQGKKLGMK